jgi:MFS family permease
MLIKSDRWAQTQSDGVIPDHSKSTAVIAVTAFAGTVAAFIGTVAIPIQGKLPDLLDASPQHTAWVITIPLLVSTICTPVSGRLGDMYGKRRIALILLGLLVGGALISANSQSLLWLLVGQGLQGTGMGVIPLGIAILRDTVPVSRLGSAIALVSASLGVGGAIGLPVSAVVTEYFDWHVLFWCAAALGTLALGLYAWIVPPSTIRSGGRFDIVGAIGLALGLAAILVAVSIGNQLGWGAPTTLAPLIGGAIVLIAWGWYQLRVTNPLVDLRVSRRPRVLVTNLASVALGFALFALSIVFPQLLILPAAEGGLGSNLVQAGLVLMPQGLAMLAMAPLAGRLERKHGPKLVLIAGSLILAVSYLLAVMIDIQIWSIILISVLGGMGIGLGFAATPILIMQAVPAEETGAANGLNTLMRTLGTSVAAAVVAAVLTQSSQASGVPAQSPGGFQSALLLGLVAALICVVLAFTIPRPRTIERENRSLPDRLSDDL